MTNNLANIHTPRSSHKILIVCRERKAGEEGLVEGPRHSRPSSSERAQASDVIRDCNKAKSKDYFSRWLLRIERLFFSSNPFLLKAADNESSVSKASYLLNPFICT
jgi:hypothetical protein